MTTEAKAAVPTASEASGQKTYAMVGFARKARTRSKGEEYITVSLTETGERYAIYTNEDGMVVKTRPPKGSTEKGKLVGTAETATDKKGGQFTIAKFNDESVPAMFLFPNKKRSGDNPPDFYVTRQA